MSVRREILICLIIIIAVAARPAGAAPGDITFVSSYLPDKADHITDVWGYAANGREYAIVGDWSIGVHIIDVTDPFTPTLALDLTYQGFDGFDVKVWDHYIYTCDGNGGATTSHVIDIADFNNPLVSPPFRSAHNFAIDPQGYLLASLLGIRIYDLRTSPTAPALTWSDGFGDAHDASVVGNRLYDFRGVFGTYIWDISDRSLPVELGHINDPLIDYDHSGYPTEDGNWLYICDELANSPTPDVTVWNIQNPASPTAGPGALDDPNATVHNLYVVDELAFTSYYSAGFRVYDVSNPAFPILEDEYDTSAHTGENFNGCFGVYPFTGSDLVYVTDQDNGLFIFSVERSVTTPVAITAFEANVENGAVHLRWQVFADEAFSGFRVYRKESGVAVVVGGAALLDHSEREYVDKDVAPAGHYQYTVAAVYPDGNEVLSQTLDVLVPSVAARLIGNHPNPFNPTTTITYELAQDGPVTVTIYDAQGSIVRTLVNGQRPAGASSETWDGKDRTGRNVPSGVYFYRLDTGRRIFTRQMVLLK